MVEIRIPEMGESITEGTIASWFKQPGDYVEQDEAVLEIETDKVTQEIYSPESGTIQKILRKEGDTVAVGETVAEIEPGAKKESASNTEAPEAAKAEEKSADSPVASPAARKIADDKNVSLKDVHASGKDGRVTKQDVLEHGKERAPAAPSPKPQTPAKPAPVSQTERETIVPMSRLRRAIAENLLNAQQNAAILTTFNEIDMKAVMDLRSRYKDDFQKKYGIKLGFMSFFVKAVVNALQEIPAINGEIRGDEIVYKNYYDIGVAVGGPKGLLVPVVRNCDNLSLAGIESEIARLATKVKDGNVSLDDLKGGTFSITNGGVYGSMMSTPIINPPQSGILGMHNIVKRAVVVNDEIVIRPMMYVALSYDHRMVDGKEAVTFLVRIKEAIEDPARLLLEV